MFIYGEHVKLVAGGCEFDMFDLWKQKKSDILQFTNEPRPASLQSQLWTQRRS